MDRLSLICAAVIPMFSAACGNAPVEAAYGTVDTKDPSLRVPSSVEPAFDYCHVSESFKDLVVGHCMLAVFPVRKYLESHPV